MTIYRKTEVIQSYLRIWGRYTPIESGPSEPKKWGFITNVNVELIRQPKGQNWPTVPPPPPHNGRTVAPEAILFESPCRAHPET